MSHQCAQRVQEGAPSMALNSGGSCYERSTPKAWTSEHAWQSVPRSTTISLQNGEDLMLQSRCAPLGGRSSPQLSLIPGPP